MDAHHYEDYTGYMDGFLKVDGTFWLSKIFIYPEHRRKGAGSKMLSMLPKRVELIVGPNRYDPGPVVEYGELITFYEKNGFVAINGGPFMKRQ
jgi:GNAT superfamily N-acetyltransferase